MNGKSAKLYLFFLVFCLLLIQKNFSQTTDSAKSADKNAEPVLFWTPRYLPDLFHPDTLKPESNAGIELHNPGLRLPAQYWDPRNAIPKNSLELDYRYSSYYTPRDVSDKITHTMNRPPADSFVPIPSLALIAASIALKYMDIQKKIEINAVDYLLPEKMYPILTALWERSPQTLQELYESHQINKDRSMELLQKDIDALEDKKLVRSKKMQLAPTQYFAAQTLPEVITEIQQNISELSLENYKRQDLVDLLKKLQSPE